MKTLRRSVIPGIFVAAVVVLTGCSDQVVEGASGGAANGDTGSDRLRLNTAAGSGSTAYTISAAWADVVGSGSASQLEVYAGTGSIAAVADLQSGASQISVAALSDAYDAYSGEMDGVSGPFEGIELLFNIYDTTLHILTPADSDITSIADLQGRKVAFLEAGSFVLPMIEAVFSHHGFSIADVDASYMQHTEQIEALREGRVEAIVQLQGIGWPEFENLSNSLDFRVLPVTDEEWEATMEGKPEGYYTRTTIPAGTYNGQDEDIPSISGWLGFTAEADLPEDQVYELVAEFWDNQEKLTDVHPVLGNLTPEDTVENMPITMHPGAERYFQEQGWLP